MIEISDLSFSMEGENILNALNLSIQDGEIVAITGREGSGKSVFLKVVSGTAQNYNGNIIFNGEPLSGMSKKSRMRTVAYFSGELPLNTEKTVSEFILLSRIGGKKLFSPYSQSDLEITESHIEDFELIPYRNKSLARLSRCTVQKAMLAHALAHSSLNLFLDNPSNYLDIRSVELLRKSLIKYCMNGKKTVIIASHDLNFISQVADKIIIFENGTAAETGPPSMLDADLIKKYFAVNVMVSRNIYNGRPEIHVFPEN